MEAALDVQWMERRGHVENQSRKLRSGRLRIWWIQIHVSLYAPTINLILIFDWILYYQSKISDPFLSPKVFDIGITLENWKSPQVEIITLKVTTGQEFWGLSEEFELGQREGERDAGIHGLLEGASGDERHGWRRWRSHVLICGQKCSRHCCCWRGWYESSQVALSQQQ